MDLAFKLAAAALLAAAASATAQEFPSKTVRIVASEAGGSGDFVARLVAQVGGSNSVHCTSLGKVLLISHSDDEIRQILSESEMERRTHYTLVTPEAFIKEMEVVRRTGIGFDDRESGDDCFCIGAPIYNHLGQVFAAISVSGPVSRLSRRTAETTVAPKLLEATKTISRSLGHVS
jgi:DNA-binding IclR family transcriptional regulator